MALPHHSKYDTMHGMSQPTSPATNKASYPPHQSQRLFHESNLDRSQLWFILRHYSIPTYT